MARVSFEKGRQREFLDFIVLKMNSPSLRGLLQFGFSLNYSTLKNYYNESRKMPLSFFEDLCTLAGFDLSEFNVKILDENWGRVKGGKIGKR